MSRRCRTCGEWFAPDFPTMRQCWECWREQNERGYERERERREPPRTVVVAPFDAELLKLAIGLCHPDRHPPERAEICNRVTAALTVALKAVRTREAA